MIRNIEALSRVQTTGLKHRAALLFRKFITSNLPVTTTEKYFHPAELLKCTAREEVRKETALGEDVKKHEKTSKQVKEILSYIECSSVVTENIKVFKSLTQRKSKTDYLYLCDERIADKIIELIQDDILADPRKIVEINAGFGLLTRRLLAKNVPYLHILERNVEFIKILAAIQSQYPTRTEIREVDILKMWKIFYQDKLSNRNNLRSLFSKFPHMEWGVEPGLRIIGTISDTSFMKQIIMDTVRQSGLVCFGRPHLYLCMPPSTWMRLTSDGSTSFALYRSTSVMFQLLYDFKIVGQLPRKSFLPWLSPPNKSKHPRNEKVKKLDAELMYLVRIKGKKDVFKNVIDSKYIHPLWFFMDHHLTARSNRVIPHMEVWRPDCGPSLIMKGFNIYTQFGDLTPCQLLELFKEFITWDEYHTSFLPSMENSFHKMEQVIF